MEKTKKKKIQENLLIYIIQNNKDLCYTRRNIKNDRVYKIMLFEVVKIESVNIWFPCLKHVISIEGT